MAEYVISSEGVLMGATSGQRIDLDLTEEVSAADARLDLTDAEHGDLLWVDTSGEEPVVRRGVSPGLWRWFQRFFSDDFSGLDGVMSGFAVEPSGASTVNVQSGTAILEAGGPDDSFAVVLENATNIYDELVPDAEDPVGYDVYAVGDAETGEVSIAVTPFGEGPLSSIPSKYLASITIPANEADATLWTYVDRRNQGTLQTHVGELIVRRFIDSQEWDDGYVPEYPFMATRDGEVGFWKSASDVTPQVAASRPTIDPTDITGNETATLTSVVNWLIALGLVIDGTP
ncbi:MAG TPA: hypothetical protein VGK43_03575 [Solirubrobacterales bacterium]